MSEGLTSDVRDIACTFCGHGRREVPRLVAADHGAAICSPCVMRCLHVLVTGDDVASTEEPSFALTVLGRAVAARIAAPAEAGAL